MGGLAKIRLPLSSPMNRICKKSRRAKLYRGNALGEAHFHFFTALRSAPLRRADRDQCWPAGPTVLAPPQPHAPGECSAKHFGGLPSERTLRPAHKGTAACFHLPALSSSPVR